MNLKGLALIAIGILISAGGLYWMQTRSSGDNTLGTVARVDLISGTASIINDLRGSSRSLQRKDYLAQLESLQTEPHSEIHLSFDSGASIQVFENSLITIDKQNKFTQLIIKRGDILIENPGPEGSLFVLKNSQRLTALEFQSGSSVHPTAALPPPDNSSPKNIGQSLAQALDSHKPNFQKCFATL
mgnify:CR=1 FL=1